jgi:hypothetical protein
MLIRVKLMARRNWAGDVLMHVDHPDAVDAVATFCGSTRTCFAENLLLHDLFHHAALGLNYTPRDEYLSSALDAILPWYADKPSREALEEERLNARDNLERTGEAIPSSAELAAVRRRARKKLAGVVPRWWVGPIQQALGTYLRRQARGTLEMPRRNEFLGDTLLLVLTLDTEAKAVRVHRAARKLSTA